MYFLSLFLYSRTSIKTFIISGKGQFKNVKKMSFCEKKHNEFCRQFWWKKNFRWNKFTRIKFDCNFLYQHIYFDCFFTLFKWMSYQQFKILTKLFAFFKTILKKLKTLILVLRFHLWFITGERGTCLWAQKIHLKF